MSSVEDAFVCRRAVGTHQRPLGGPAVGWPPGRTAPRHRVSRAARKISGTFIMMSMNRLSGDTNERRYFPRGLNRRPAFARR